MLCKECAAELRINKSETVVQAKEEQFNIDMQIAGQKALVKGASDTAQTIQARNAIAKAAEDELLPYTNYYIGEFAEPTLQLGSNVYNAVGSIIHKASAPSIFQFTSQGYMPIPKGNPYFNEDGEYVMDTNVGIVSLGELPKTRKKRIEEMSKYDLAKKLIDENNEFGDRHDSPALRQGADIAKGLGVLGKNTALAFLPGGIGVAGAAAYGEDYTQGVLNNSVNPYVEGIISGGISVGTDAFMDAIAPSVVEVFDTNCKKIFGKSFEKLTTQQKEYVVKIFAPTIYEWKTMQ